MQSSSSIDVDKLVEELPKMFFMESEEMCKWEGFWSLRQAMKPIITFRSSFLARDDDVFLASPMKTGTTWLKALALCITQNHQTLNDILTKETPHYSVPNIEGANFQNEPPPFDIYDSSVARLLHTHLPYAALPDSLKNSKCKIVYIARNPKDTVVSMWRFFQSFLDPNQEPFSLAKMVDCFVSGVHLYGPFFEHVVGYWEESKKRPEKVLFLNYDELRSDPQKQVLRIAEFLGRPFTNEGEAEEVVRRCSLERLKNLEVNQSGSLYAKASNSSFFRKGEVGGWKHHLTPEMEMQIDEACRLKFEPFGLFL